MQVNKNQHLISLELFLLALLVELLILQVLATTQFLGHPVLGLEIRLLGQTVQIIQSVLEPRETNIDN